MTCMWLSMSPGRQVCRERSTTFAPAGTATPRPAAAIRPPHGELAESDWRRPHVAVATATGIRAGEEMLGWLLARVDADATPTS